MGFMDSIEDSIDQKTIETLKGQIGAVKGSIERYFKIEG